ncbi:MAG: hypothetical protein CMO19_01640 [Thaumarchaeota archaeon]|nr:hypothetical protein [Nitrososphaerota archaeon]
MENKTVGIIEIIVATLIWGSLGVMVRNIDMDPFSIVAYRALIALPIMLVLFRKKKENLKKNYKLLFLASIAIAMAWSAHFYAFKLTTIANTVVLLYTGPIYVAILSPLVLKEVREKKANICLVLSIAGIFLMYNQGLGDELNDRGLMLGAISGILFAFVIMATKKLSKDYSSITIVTMQLLMSAIILSPALFVEQQIVINNILLLLVLGLVHTAIAEFLYIDGLIKVSTQKASTISYIEPASAIIYAIILLNEIPEGLEIIGIALITTANIILNLNLEDIKRMINR